MKRLLTAALCAAVLFAVQPVIAAEGEGQKAVLITGASTGIGRLTAERLAANGYFVYAGARKAKDIESLNAIENVKAVRLDVTVQEEIDAAVELVQSEGRGLWGVVNNAGVAGGGPLIEVSEDELKFLFDVNVYGVFRVTKAFAPLIIESKGRIVNISSISGFLSGYGYGPYSMTKHAVEAFNDSLSREMRQFEVEVVAIEPGNYSTAIGNSVCTRMLADTDAKPYVYYEEYRQQQLQRCRETVEGKTESRNPEPYQVAEAVEDALFDAKPKQRYLVVPEQRQAGWTVFKAFGELMTLNEEHEFSYSYDEMRALLDFAWPYTAGKKSFDNEQEAAEFGKFVESWFVKGEVEAPDE